MPFWKIGRGRFSEQSETPSQSSYARDLGPGFILKWQWVMLSAGFIIIFMVDITFGRADPIFLPHRVVTLSPSLGELAAEVLGLDLDRLAGVAAGTEYPPALRRKESVGPSQHPSIEKIVSLNPDLVLASESENSPDAVDFLKNLGLTVVVVKTEDFEQIESTMGLVSASMGASQVGMKLIGELRQGLNRFRQKVSRLSSLQVAQASPVLIQLGNEPLRIANAHSFFNGALEAIGAKGITTLPIFPSRQSVLERDPEAIVIVAEEDAPNLFLSMKFDWLELGRLKAVRNFRIREVRADLFRPTLRVLEGLSQLSRAVYGNY